MPLRYKATVQVDRNPFYLVESDLVAGAVVKLCSARAFMRGHRLGVFERAAGLEISGDTRRSEHVAAKFPLQAGLGCAAADHLIGVDTMHRLGGQYPGSAKSRAEEGSLPRISDSRRIEIFIKEQFELVVRRHFVAFAAFLMQSQPRPGQVHSGDHMLCTRRQAGAWPQRRLGASSAGLGRASPAPWSPLRRGLELPTRPPQALNARCPYRKPEQAEQIGRGE